MANEACSYGANCICAVFPTKIDLIKCKCTKWTNNCDIVLHDMCQTSCMEEVNYDDGLQYVRIECINKRVYDAALKEFDNILNTNNTKQTDQTETTTTQSTTTRE